MGVPLKLLTFLHESSDIGAEAVWSHGLVAFLDVSVVVSGKDTQILMSHRNLLSLLRQGLPVKRWLVWISHCVDQAGVQLAALFLPSGGVMLGTTTPSSH